MGYSPWDCQELDMTELLTYMRTHSPLRLYPEASVKRVGRFAVGCSTPQHIAGILEMLSERDNACDGSQ